MNTALVTRMKSTLAGAAGLGSAAYFWLQLIDQSADPKPVAYLPIAGLVLAAIAVQFASLGAQLVARGLWWSNLVLGVIICVSGTHHESSIGLGLALGCAAALVLADRRALAAAAERADFRPVAFPGTLQLLMVLALADAPTLLLFSYVEHGVFRSNATPFLAATALALLVGFVGLYRLSLWGVAVTAGASLLLGAGLASGLVTVEHDLRAPLTVLSAVQVLVALPMLLSLATRTPLPSPSARVRSALATALVVALAVAALLVTLWRQ